MKSSCTLCGSKKSIFTFTVRRWLLDKNLRGFILDVDPIALRRMRICITDLNLNMLKLKDFFICRKFEDFLPACLYFCSVRCFSNVYLVLNQSFYTLGRQDNGFEVAGFFSPFFSRFFTLKPKRQNVSFSRICEKTKTVLAFWRFFDCEIFVILKWCLKDCISWT